MGSALRRWILVLVISIVWYGPLLLFAASRDSDMILFVVAIAGLPGNAFATLVAFLLGVSGHDMATARTLQQSRRLFSGSYYSGTLWARRTSGPVAQGG
jgi:hypothetical protein